MITYVCSSYVYVYMYIGMIVIDNLHVVVAACWCYTGSNCKLSELECKLIVDGVGYTNIRCLV